MKIFGLGARMPYPAKITIDINTQCNAKCIICPYPGLKGKLKHGVMDMGLYTKIIDDFAGVCYRNSIMGEVSYCNMSEPTLVPRLPEYIKYARDKGCFTIYLNTNGSNFSKGLVDTFIKEKTYPAIHINIMVFQKENYERVMGLNFERVKENVRYLLDNYPHSLIDIGFFAMLMDKAETEAAKDFFKGTKVKLHLATDIADRASNVGLPDALADFRSRPKDRLFGCSKNRPIHRMQINYDGRVYLCDQDMGLETDLGSVKDSAIEDVWNGRPMMDMLSVIYANAAAGKTAVPCFKCESGVDNADVRLLDKPGDYKPRRLLGPVKRWLIRKGWVVLKKRGKLGLK